MNPKKQTRGFLSYAMLTKKLTETKTRAYRLKDIIAQTPKKSKNLQILISYFNETNSEILTIKYFQKIYEAEHLNEIPFEFNYALEILCANNFIKTQNGFNSLISVNQAYILAEILAELNIDLQWEQ